MKTKDEDASLSTNEFYDSVITDNEAMKWFIERYDVIDIVNLYQYILRKAKALSDQDKEANKEMISMCWLASMELEHTDAVRRYLKGEITQEDVDEYEVKKQAEIDAIVELLEKRKKAKTPLGKLKRMFSPTNSKTR